MVSDSCSVANEQFETTRFDRHNNVSLNQILKTTCTICKQNNNSVVTTSYSGFMYSPSKIYIEILVGDTNLKQSFRVQCLLHTMIYESMQEKGYKFRYYTGFPTYCVFDLFACLNDMWSMDDKAYHDQA